MSGFPGVGGEFGPYLISGMLGRGGMGLVFEARDRRLNRAVALKVLSPLLSGDQHFRARFEHEAGVLAKLDSAHVVQIFEYGEIDGCLYLAAQLIPGGDLKTEIESRGALPRELALDVVHQVTEALIDAAELGIVHRDIKPSNILLRRRGQAHQAYLCDFGIAYSTDAAHTRTGQVIGSVPYMSPEQHQGQRPDVRGDIYALGCVLWDALTGEPPYRGTEIQVAMSHISGPVPQLSGVDPVTVKVNEIFRMALAKDPDERFQHPEEFRLAVSDALALARRTTAVTSPAGGDRGPGPAGGSSASSVPAPRRRVPRQRRSAESVPTIAAGSVEAPIKARTVELPNTSGRAVPVPRLRRRRVVAGGLAVALAVCATLVVAARDRSGPGSDPSAGAGRDRLPRAVEVIRPSDRPGGTVRVAYRVGRIATDPGQVYTLEGLNAVRLTARSLMFARQTADGDVPVPDLAVGPGVPSDGGTTWTYRLRSGLRYSDGTPITSRDVAAAVLAASSPEASKAGTSPYLGQLLRLPAGWGRTGGAALDASSAVETPDDRTIEFHLRRQFYEFDALMALPQTAPAPPRSGATEPAPSSGPYRFAARPTQQGFRLVRNKYWSDDPNRSALPDALVFRAYPSVEAVNEALGTGRADVALGPVVGTAPADSAQGAFGTVALMAINPQVTPFQDSHCRRAVAAAMNPRTLGAAFGGDSQGRFVTTLLPPGIPGRVGFDHYGTRSHPDGDLALARREMAACTEPGGFTVRLAYGRISDQVPGYVPALAAALARVGITLAPVPVAESEFRSSTCGSESLGVSKGVGICVGSWAPDWRSGYGFLGLIADPRMARGSLYNSSVRSESIGQAFDVALAKPDQRAREQAWSRLDSLLVKSALLVPLFAYQDRYPLPPALKNLVVSDAYGSFDLVRVGVR